MLPHHVNIWIIPVNLGIVFWEYAKIPETGTDKRMNILQNYPKINEY